MNLLESLHLYSKLLIFLFLIRWKVLMDQAGLMACLNLGMLDIHSVYGEDAQTLLIVAVNDGAIDAVRFLLNQDVDIQYQDRNGQSALMYAAIAGHHDIVALLLKAGAEINLCNRFGQNALLCSCYLSIAVHKIAAGFIGFFLRSGVGLAKQTASVFIIKMSMVKPR